MDLSLLLSGRLSQMTKTQAYAGALYARMEEEANENNLWVGKIVETCTSLGIPAGGYNRAMNALRKLECVELLARGSGGDRQSIVRLVRPPTPEVWQDGFVKSRDPSLTTGPSLDMLRQEVRDMQKQIGGLNLIDALANFENRIATLERFVETQTASYNPSSTT